MLITVAALATLTSDILAVSMIEWFKLPPRLIFFVGAGVLFYNRPATFVLTIKCFVLWCLGAVGQHFVLCITGGYRFPTLLGDMNAVMAGPLGLLGNVSSLVSPAGLPFSIPRLCGFWNEPSNASAAMFSSFFFSRALYQLEGRRLWQRSAVLCFAGGLATLSNAGFVAISGALALGVFQSRSAQVPFKALVLFAALLLGIVSLAGRSLVVNYAPDNEVLKVLVGVRKDVLSASDIERYDSFDGRLDLMKIAVEQVYERPIGLGVFTKRPQDDTPVSASGPVIWFIWTGVIGAIFLAVKETAVAFAAWRYGSRNPVMRYVGQAWFVIFLQNMSYGDLIGPLLLLSAAAVTTNVADFWAHSTSPYFNHTNHSIVASSTS